MNYIIIIILVLITALSIYISFIYNNIYIKLFAGSILIIFGLSLFSGISYPIGETSTDIYDLHTFENESDEHDHIYTLQNGTITTNVIQNYTNVNNYITNAIALILVLGGVLIFIFQPIEQKPVI